MRWNFGKILRNINDKSGELFEFIFPSRCISCAEVLNDSNRGSLEIFCKLCADSVEERGENFCPVCGIRHQGITGVSECGDCIKNPKPFQRILYRFVYGGAIGDAVTAFKYRHNLFAGRRLVYETLAFHSDVIAGSVPDIIIPVPQHLLRYLVRSFSPTAYIASVLSAATSIPVGYNIL
ncbi:MAG: double zinc ribbon domain-containing protein, partial [Deltaproteobacteria bacterium]|nr:double zinc ribbon domain-containing protein [Deltaproteobacteria bacterium]